MSTAEPSFVPWRAQVFFIEHPLSVSFVFRYAKAWQSCSLPILVRIGVLLRRSAYGLLLYRTGSEEEAYSAPLEKRHFTVEVCRASALSGKPGEQRTWMRRIIIPFPQSCRNILATDPFKGSHLYCALCLYCAAGNSPPPHPEMSFPPGGPTGSLLGYLPTLEQAGIVHARPRVRRVSQAAWGRRVWLHTRGLRRRDRVRQNRHRRVRSMKV